MRLEYNFSPAEVGAVVSALQAQYSSAEVGALCQSLCNQVYRYFVSIGFPDMYDDWISEFQIVE